MSSSTNPNPPTGAFDWEKIERRQHRTVERALQTSDGITEIPLYVSDLRKTIEHLRDGSDGSDRFLIRGKLTPPSPENRRLGGLDPDEFRGLFDEVWPEETGR